MSPKRQKAWRKRMDSWFHHHREFMPAYTRYQRFLARKADRIQRRQDPLCWSINKAIAEQARNMRLELEHRLLDRMRTDLESRGPLH